MEKKKDDNLHFAVGMGGLVLVAVISQRQNEIKHWLYDHMMMLVLAAFLLVGFIVMRAIQKMKKREEEFLKRMRAVKSVAPARNEGDYYRRER